MFSSRPRAVDDEEDEDRSRRQYLKRRNVITMEAVANTKRARFSETLSDEGRERRSRGLPRSVLLDPDKSPWQRLYDSGSDQAFITVTGFSHEAFFDLLQFFEPLFERYTPWTGDNDGRSFKILPRKKKGRPRLITAHSCLGLCLSWYRFRGAEYIMQGWFGFTATHCNVWLRFSRRILFMALHQNYLAKVRYPDDATIEEYKAMIERRHPALKDVYATADGLKLYFEKCWDGEAQNKFYNGWLHSHFITNLFVFGADGRIIKCVLNCPGTLHDSTLANWGGVYSKMEEVYERTQGKVCVDSAFEASSNAYLIKSATDLTQCKTRKEIRIALQATSLRQAAEWGMRAIQSAFPRLKDVLRFEEKGERRIILQLVPLLYNMRLELVGLNQLRNVYAPTLSKDSMYAMDAFGGGMHVDNHSVAIEF